MCDTDGCTVGQSMCVCVCVHQAGSGTYSLETSCNEGYNTSFVIRFSIIWLIIPAACGEKDEIAKTTQTSAQKRTEKSALRHRRTFAHAHSQC